jgi:cobalamin synthase
MLLFPLSVIIMLVAIGLMVWIVHHRLERLIRMVNGDQE